MTLAASWYTGLLFFWYGFVRKSLPDGNVFLKYTLCIVYSAGAMMVPTRFLFIFVQTGIVFSKLVGYHMKEEHEKDYFASLASLCAFPITLVPWVESLACSSFLVHYGGHLIYDLSIPGCFLMYFFIAKMSTHGKVNSVPSKLSKVKAA